MEVASFLRMYSLPWMTTATACAVTKVRNASLRAKSQGGFEAAPEVARHKPVDERIAATIDVRQQMAFRAKYMKYIIKKYIYIIEKIMIFKEMLGGKIIFFQNHYI